MPDNKTVTFDASQYQLVPKVPTQEMLDAASHASMQHLLDCINDPVKARELGSEENARKTHASRYQSMLAAAPTPAAQSAGQEAVAEVRDNPDDIGTIIETLGERPLPVGMKLYAAPVNGGEREATPLDNITGTVQYEQKHAALRATDAQQVGAALLPKYTEWMHLRTHGQWSDGVPAWARDHSGRMNDLAAALAVISELYDALTYPAKEQK